MSHHGGQVDSKLQLAHWGLPTPVLAAFAKKGLQQLYPWQAAALECGAAGNNLVYCAPTSGGKSLVAEVLMLVRMCKAQQAMPKPSSRHKHQQQAPPLALLVLPYLSIVAEKTAHLSTLLEGMKWRVKGYRAETEGQPLTSKAERIAICSIEKANIAINHLIQEQRLHELVSVVVDEAHMLADPNRGAALEMLLSKLVACRASCNVQIVAMSATMSGLDSLSDWLDAQLFLTNFRPVPLFEHVVFEGMVFLKADKPGLTDSTGDACPLIEQRRLPVHGKDDKLTLVALVAEVVKEHHSVLVFCLGRQAAESCASMLAAELANHLGPPTAEQAAARHQLIEQLRIAMAGHTNKKFEGLLACGIAYHHAGLTHQERSAVEEGYRSGVLLVLTATSTLAAGVNLPARRVILRSLWQGVGPVGRAQYLQMVGRAGRAGQSAVGESFLMGKGAAGVTTSNSEWSAVCKLITSPMPALTSQLVTNSQPHPACGSGAGQATGHDGRQVANVRQQGPCAAGSGSGQAHTGQAVQPAASTGVQQQASSSGQTQDVDCKAQPQLQQLLLHGISTGLVNTGQTVVNLVKSTLAFHQLPWDELSVAVKTALTALRARKLVSLRPDSEDGPSYWALTPLGAAVVASTLPPEAGLMLHMRMSATLCHLVMAGHMHLLYQLQAQPLFDINDWSQWSRIASSFTPQQRRIAELEGVQQWYVDRRLAGMRGDPTLDQKHARLAAAWLMDQVITDSSCVMDLEETWGSPGQLTLKGISRGQLQSWQSDVSKTAAMAALLAGSAGWWQLEALLMPLAAQAAAGVRPELMPLMEVPGMQPSHAAALHSAGFHRPEMLVCASEHELAAALAAKMPGNTRKRSKDVAHRGVGLVGSSGNKSLLAARAAKSLLEAARQHAVRSAATHASDAAAAPGQMQPTVELKPVLGQATVHQVWPAKKDPLLQRLLDGWQQQPTFTFAVLTEQQQCSVIGCKGGNSSSSSSPSPAHTELLSSCMAPLHCGHSLSCCQLHCRVPVALALCWTDKAAAVLHLPCSTPATAADGAVHAQVWAVIKEVFADANRTASCSDSAEAIAALRAVGIDCRLTVDDPCVAFLLWQPRVFEQREHVEEQKQQQDQLGDQAVSLLKAAQSTVLGSSWKLLMPLLDHRLAGAARAALLTRALMPRMRALLVQQKLCQAYESVDRVLQAALGSVRATGVQVAVAAVQQQLQQCNWQQAMLQHRAVQLLQHSSGVGTSQPSHVHALLHQLHLGTSQKKKNQQLSNCLQQAIRCALRTNQLQHLPVLQCMLTYWKLNKLEQQLQALLQYRARNTSSGSSHIKLQPATGVVPFSGELSAMLPADVHALFSHLHVPYLPVVISAGSLADLGMSSLAAGASVLVGQPAPQQQQPTHYMGILASVSQLPRAVDPQLPFGSACQLSQFGVVRRCCSITQCVQEAHVGTGQLYVVLPPASTASHGRGAFVPASLSLLGAIQPSQPGRTFIQLHLDQLPLVVLAALSKDEELQAALSHEDPLAAAAQHWLQHSGLQGCTTELLLSRVAAGAVDGNPVPTAEVSRVLFSCAVDALLHGRSQAVQRSLLAVEQPVDLAESLQHAFPKVAAWRSALLEDCRRTGYLATLIRKHPFKLPPVNATSADLRALREAERTGCSVVLLGSCGDVERVAAAALHHCCSSCFACGLVMAGQRMLVLETPASAALPLLRASGGEVQAKLKSCLGLEAEVQLPFRWCLGASLDAALNDQHRFC